MSDPARDTHDEWRDLNLPVYGYPVVFVNLTYAPLFFGQVNQQDDKTIESCRVKFMDISPNLWVPPR